MLYNCCYVFLLFLFYAILGYIAEIICCSIIEKKLVINRGFCLGPYLPIYGISCVIMSFYLVRYKNDPLALFVMACLVCTLIEYITSYLLEVIFKTRWWDYTDKKFNIDGRVCLGNSFLFGIGGLACIYLFQPLMTNILNRFSSTTLIVIGIIAMIIFLTDVIITVVTMCQLKIASQNFKNKDATSEITQLIHGEVIKNSTLIRHMLNAFPKIDVTKQSTSIARIKHYLQEKSENIKQSKKNFKTKIRH